MSPSKGHLACRFHSTDEPYIYTGVPEAKYQALIHSPYAGSYFRKYIMGRYPCLNSVAPKYQPTENGPARKKAAQSRARLASVTVARPIEVDLFGNVEMSGSQRKRKGSSSNG